MGLTNGNFNLRYDYEANSHLVKTLTFRNTNATRMTTSKSYDKVNRLLGISSTASGMVLLESYAYEYNAASQRTKMKLADGAAWNYGYDALGQVTSGKKNWADGSAVPGQQFEYGYDDIGNRIFVKEGGDNNGNGLRRSGYSVDSVNQYTSRTNAPGLDVLGIANALASVTVNNQTTYRKGEYFQKELSVNNTGGAQYQQITNIASIPAGGGSLVSSDGGQVYVPPATETFTHDLDGNLTQNGRWNLVWDAENRLINVAARNGSETATNIAFQYDNLWRRTYKKVSLNNGTYTTNRFAYDGWNLVAEFDGATNLLKSYMWGKDLSGTEQGAGGVGGLVSMTLHSGTYAGTYFYAYDGNGNVTALINGTNGAVYARYEYDPFHNLIRSTGPLAKLNNFLAATKYYDWETEFYYYGYRYYEPDTGRWLSRDPIFELAFKETFFQIFRRSISIRQNQSASVGQNANNNNFLNSVDYLGLQIIPPSKPFSPPPVSPQKPCPCGEPAAQVSAVGPFDALTARRLANEVLAAAQNSGLPGLHNGPADAFRHCFWSCRMAQEIGAEQAEAVGNVHEICRGGPPGEISMDLFNNTVGRGFGQPGADCRDSCFTAAQDGTLQNSPGGTPSQIGY